MSLIEAALRKAHVPPSVPENSEVSASKARPPLTPTMRGRMPPVMWWLGGGFAVAIGLLLYEAVRLFHVSAAPPTTPLRHAAFSLHRTSREAELKLSGIIKGSDESLAIINGTVVRPGDVVEGALVTEVNTTSVRLRRRTKDIILKQTPN